MAVPYQNRFLLCKTIAYEMMQLDPGIRVAGRDLGNDFVPHGTVKKLYENCGLDPEHLAAFAKEGREA